METRKFQTAPNLNEYLKLPRCPHCSIDNPNLETVWQEFKTVADDNTNQRLWRIYKCKRCGGVIIAYAYEHNRMVIESYPTQLKIDDNLPEKVKIFLQQAIDSTFAPVGAILLCGSAVDEMLKQKGYVEGKLYERIKKATEGGLLTKEMSDWAHKVRLDANDQRHADIEATLPTVENAKQSIEFTKMLSEILFVLPAKIKEGIEKVDNPQEPLGGRGGN
jgi:Domain of unknown function (DUF4145)